MLFRRIAGLTKNRAKNIVTWRKRNGGFVKRIHLKKVHGIGEKTFQQCAGFVRVFPKTTESASM